MISEHRWLLYLIASLLSSVVLGGCLVDMNFLGALGSFATLINAIAGLNREGNCK